MGRSTTSGSFPRRNFYIDKKFQNKFILKFCALVVVGAVLTTIGLYVMTQLSTTVSIVKSRVVVMTTADFLLPILVQTATVVTLVVGVATAIVTLFVSHKIAGPLYRFKQTFKELSQGNFSNQVRLRKDDQLHEVAGEFNHMISVIRTQTAAAQSALKAVKAEMEAIGEESVDEHKRKRFSELKLKLQELEQAVNFFKI